MTTEIIAILAAFSSEFTRPTWKNIQILFIGAILCRGARRITSILRVMGVITGLGQKRHRPPKIDHNLTISD